MAKVKMNTFSKLMVLIIFLLLPVIGLYAASNRISMNVVRDEVQSLKSKDLHLYANQIDNSVDLLSTLGLLLSEDTSIRELQDLDLFYNVYERNQTILRLFQRLSLLNISTGWDTHISVYSPESRLVISTNTSVSYQEDYLRDHLTLKWTLNRNDFFYSGEERFIRHIIQPGNLVGNLDHIAIVVELSFSKRELVRSLDELKQGGRGDPFFYNPGQTAVLNHSSDEAFINRLLAEIKADEWNEISNSYVTVDDKTYLLNAVLIPSIGWYLVDYEPIDDILKPIVASRNLFYFAIGTQLILGSLAAFILYRQVQVPIRILMKGLQNIKKGDYSNRIKTKPGNEFSFLFQRFNDMSEEIQNLIQKVYTEQLRSREANLKQLQSQINPHFLYNCFALIRSLTRLGEKESVMELAMHLSKYYRYTTRVEKSSGTLQEELQLITSYLEIQKMHLQRLSYRFNIEDSMMSLEIPRLLLQPLVENAVIHGIEPMPGHGHITISGCETDSGYEITVADNGVGLDAVERGKLEQSLLYPPDDETGCALWNIRQRLKISFGPEAELEFPPVQDQGFSVCIRWRRLPE